MINEGAYTRFMDAMNVKTLSPKKYTCVYPCCIYIYIYMAAAQNVRSGSSPGPTNDPDL